MGLLRKTRRRIRREAADWVVRLAGEADEAERAEFGAWYGQDIRHAEAFDRVSAIWMGAARVSRAPARADPPSVPVPWRRPWGYAMAAAVAAALGLAAFMLISSRGPHGPAEGEADLYLAAAGEVRQFDLPDGSRMILDSGSRARVRFSARQRRVVLLAGRARHMVARESRPFIVAAGSSAVIATGTIFDVALSGRALSVFLLEGSVEVRGGGAGAPGGARRMRAGEKLVLVAGEGPVRQPPTRDDRSWPARMLEFDDAPLAEAAALVNRHSAIQVRLGEGTSSLTVSGAYRASDGAGFARSVAVAFNLRLSRQADGSLMLSAASNTNH